MQAREEVRSGGVEDQSVGSGARRPRAAVAMSNGQWATPDLHCRVIAHCGCRRRRLDLAHCPHVVMTRIPRPVQFPRESRCRALLLAFDAVPLTRRHGRSSVGRHARIAQVGAAPTTYDAVIGSTVDENGNTVDVTGPVLTVDGKAQRRRDLAFGSTLLLAGLATMAYSVNGLLRPRSVLGVTDDGISVRVDGAGHPALLLPWASIVEVRSGVRDDEGADVPVLSIHLDDPAMVPIDPAGGVSDPPWCICGPTTGIVRPSDRSASRSASPSSGRGPIVMLVGAHVSSEGSSRGGGCAQCRPRPGVSLRAPVVGRRPCREMTRNDSELREFRSMCTLPT